MERSKLALKKPKTTPLTSNSHLSTKETIELYKNLKLEAEELDKRIAEYTNQGIDTNLKPQMEALHEYNEMKDIAQQVLGLLADLKQTTVGEVHKVYGLPTD